MQNKLESNRGLLTIIIVLSMALCLVGCGKTYQEATGQTENEASNDFANGYFTVITEWNDSSGFYKIMYANDTKVKYMAIRSGYGIGITPLYNADGTLQIYEESEDKNAD